ncbi:MAG: nuclear transport factor 2 family protein [Planctomycetota bacterium]|jgi:hypothetical protein
MRPTPAKLALLVLVGIALAVYAGWKIVLALRSDETRVLLVLEDVALLANEKDGGGVLEYLDPDYRHAGGFDYATVRRIVAVYFLRAESVEAEIEPVSPVRVEGDVATVTVRARVSLRLQGQTLTLRGAGLGGDTFVVTLKRHKSYFRCTGVREAVEGDPGVGGEAGAE